MQRDSNSDDRGWRAVCLALLGLYVLLFAFNSFTRTREFEDGDTMNFVDVARHVAAGQGVRQSVLGFDQPVFGVDDPIPTPLTHQPPLFPLTVAALSHTGLSITDAALVISGVCYGFTLLASYFIAARLFGRREALATVLLLALYAPLRDFSRSAFSDPLGLALMLGAYWLLASYGASQPKRPALAAVAGLVAATAVATRYALAPLVVVGAWFVFVEASYRVRDAVLFLVAPALVAAALVWHNMSILHGSPVPHYLPSTTGYVKNFLGAMGSLVSEYSDLPSAPLKFAALLAVLAAICFVAVRRGRLLSALSSAALTGKSAHLLTAFVFLYLTFLIVQRSHSYIDPISARYLLPGSVVIVMLFAAFAVRAVAVEARTLAVAGTLAALAMVGHEMYTTATTAKYDAQRLIDESGRLTWIQKSTTGTDMIIGEDTVDVAFYFHRPAAVSYSPFPYTETLPYDKLIALCHRFRPEYSRVLLIVRTHGDLDTPRGRRRLGPFIHDATAGQLQNYPQIVPLASFPDGRAFQVGCS
jgi:Dolichyl-phosphate-mannose-protein mannosyltransferase